MGIDSSGRIVLAGMTQTTVDVATKNFALARYTSTGALDTTFGTSGKVTTDFGGLEDILYALEIYSNNKILVVGRANLSGNSNFGLVRYTSAGVLDSTFGTGGKVTTDFVANSYEAAFGVAFDSAGKILVSGHSLDADNSNFALARYTSAGVLDTTFSSDGKVTTDFFGFNNIGYEVATDASGRIVVAGIVATASGSETTNFGLVRYTSTGALDASFGTGGKVTTDFSGNFDVIRAMVIDDVKKTILVGGGMIPLSGTNRNFAMARYFYEPPAAVSDIILGNGNLGNGNPSPGPVSYPCFKKGAKILTDKGYKRIEKLKPGDLVQTYLDGYKKIFLIGKRDIVHNASDKRIQNQLYKCIPTQYPDIFEDLVLTGCHSMLVDEFESETQERLTRNLLGDIYLTDDYYRLPVCLDDRAMVYELPGTYTIYHIALEHDDYYMNYGIYANGLLVESCSKRYLIELSNMNLS